MRIGILANFNNKTNSKIEESIVQSLESMGHKVLKFNEADVVDLINDIEGADMDMFLFFKGGVESGAISMEKFKDILYNLECDKVCWYFDKVWQGRENYIKGIAPLTDFIFLTDGTFIRRHKYLNMYQLRQATDVLEKTKGKERDELKVPIVFTGSIYGQRAQWAGQLKQRYGEAFQIVNGIFDDDLTDLCESASIIVAPEFPQDDFYWSNRPYNILGRAGFLIHPKLHGLKQEFEDGKHIVYYKDINELFEKIDYYLENEKERNKIRKAGQKHCLKEFNYEKAFEETFKIMGYDI